MAGEDHGWNRDWAEWIPEFHRDFNARGSWCSKRREAVQVREERLQEFINDLRYWTHDEVEELLLDTDASAGSRSDLGEPLRHNTGGTEDGLRDFQDRWRALYIRAGRDEKYLGPDGFGEILAAFKFFGLAYHSEMLSLLHPHRFWQFNSCVNDLVEVTGYDLPKGSSRPEKRYFAVGPLLDDILMELRGQGMPSDYRMVALFLQWLTVLQRYGKGGPKPETVRFWKIEAGAEPWQWEACRERGFLGIGWEETGDLSGITREEFNTRWEEASRSRKGLTDAQREQLWSFATVVKPGDVVVANRGTGEVLGIGTVTGPYFFVPLVRGGHRLPVRWDDPTPRPVRQKGWTLTLMELDRESFERVQSQTAVAHMPPVPSEGCPFSRESFDLLEALHESPTREFYLAHREVFREFLETPFRTLLVDVAESLTPEMREVLETERGVLGRILKDAWDRGGVWGHYWGAFYPKGGRRIRDAQLFLWINKDRLEMGFAMGACAGAPRRRFLSNSRRYRHELTDIMERSFMGVELLFGDQGRERPDPLTWESWLREPAEHGIRVTRRLDRADVLGKTLAELVRLIMRTYWRLFPLIQLTLEEDPLPMIADFIHWESGEGSLLNPTYSLSQCAEDTCYDERAIQRWLRTIHRKGQVIFSGPPGSGKTFAAQRLARLITAGGDGFWEFMQFHPSVTYEDFVQRVLWGRREEDGLRCLRVPGRFLEFCRRARNTTGTW